MAIIEYIELIKAIINELASVVEYYDYLLPSTLLRSVLTECL
jgi:hypothetical protein